MKTLIVGGVAGGMSAATRLRRLNEDAEIIVFERGLYVSFANCGLPYYIGGVIKERSKLLVQTAEKLHQRFRLDVRANSEVTCINRDRKTVNVSHDGKVYEESYDQLILSTGAKPIRPRIQGIDLANNVFTLRGVPDAEKILNALEKRNVQSAAIIGAGFIGLEMAENLTHRGIKVTVIERENQVLPPLDIEMAAMVELELLKNKLCIVKGKSLNKLEDAGATLVLDDGSRLQADIILMSVGVAPETSLARDAQLDLGIRGAVIVNEQLQTNDPSIFAIGDAILVNQMISGKPALIPLASPANRQGRMVADIISGMDRSYQGTLGTAIVRTFDQVAAVTGLNEKALRRDQVSFEVIHTTPPDHASYYPGSAPMTIKLIFVKKTGRLLGAQIVGKQGVDKTIDVLSTAIKAGMSVSDLTELELAYAPPFNSAKAPVNLLGYAAQNMLEDAVDSVQWHEVDQRVNKGEMLVDVRTVDEYSMGHLPNSTNLPLDELRNRISELPKERKLIVTCQVGLRGYLAARILAQNGYQVSNLDGGFKLYKAVFPERIQK
jgi:NADPH-dependent 2,4-dienoyl-CoA reductase/sulfur reductase-like enzyme/rhodanese-related sulfurtransferase